MLSALPKDRITQKKIAMLQTDTISRMNISDYIMRRHITQVEDERKCNRFLNAKTGFSTDCS